MITKTSVFQYTLLITTAVFIGTFVAMVLFVLPNQAHAATLTQTMDVGDQGGDVTSLQTYLATNASIYPSGLVTGFFGPLTQAAVARFQTAQGIVSSGTPATTGYGRVGPATLARINALMGSPENISWDTVPVVSRPTIQTTNTTVTLYWTTNESTLGQVYWSIAPIQFDEATGPHQTPYVSGALAVDAGGQLTSHSVTISNLQPNTPYNYLVRSIDNGGNITIIWPSSFRTNN